MFDRRALSCLIVACTAMLGACSGEDLAGSGAGARDAACASCGAADGSEADASDATTGAADATAGEDATSPAVRLVPDLYAGRADRVLNVSASEGVLANDLVPSDRPAEVVLISGPNHGALSLESTGAFSYLPSSVGDDVFFYEVRGSKTASAAVTLRIAPGNQPPRAADLRLEINEDEVSTSSRALSAYGTDADSTRLSALLVDQPAHGNASLTADGKLVVIMAPNYFGQDRATYRIEDDEGAASNLASIFISVDPVPDAPRILGLTSTTAVEGFAYTGRVLVEDPDGDRITVTLVEAPLGMSIDEAGTGLLAWTPRRSQGGSDVPVRLQATDGVLTSTIVELHIHVIDRNDPPRFVSTPPARIRAGSVFAYAARARDPDLGDSLAYSMTRGVPGMSIDSGTGDLSWLPAVPGAYDVALRVTDAAGAGDEQRFTVVVESSVPPTASFRTARGLTVSRLEDGARIVSASSQSSPASLAISTLESPVPGWLSDAGQSSDQSFLVELPRQALVARVLLRGSASPNGTRDFRLSASPSCAPLALTEVLSATLPNDDFGHEYEFNPVRARCIEFRAIDNYGGLSIQLGHLELREQAREGGIVSLLEAGASVVSASSGMASAASTIDFAGATTAWSAGAVPQSIVIALPEPVPVRVDRVRFARSPFGSFARTFAVSTSTATTDDSAFTFAGGGELPLDNVTHDFELAPALARYVKLDILDAWGTAPFLVMPDFEVFSSELGGLVVPFEDLSRAENGEVVAWFWDFGDGIASHEQYPTHVYAAPGTYSVTLTVQDDTGLSARTTGTYIALAPPAADMSFSPDPPVEGQPIAFTDQSTSSVPILEEAWGFGDGTTHSGPSATITPADSGAFAATLTVTDAHGVSASVTRRAGVRNRPPVISAGTPCTIAWGEDWHSDATVSDASVADTANLICTWSFGDGRTVVVHRCTTATVRVPNAYAVPGVYTATLLVEDPHGASTVDSVMIAVTTRSTLLFLEDAISASAAGEVSLSARIFDGLAPHAPLGGMPITFVANGQVETVASDVEGHADVTLTFAPGIPTTVVARYDGDLLRDAALAEATFEPAPFPGVPRRGAPSSSANRARRFVVGFLHDDARAPGATLRLALSCQVHTLAAVVGPDFEARYELAPGVASMVEVPNRSAIATPGSIEPKGIEIEALDDISVQVFDSREAYAASAALGTNYLVPSYPTDDAGNSRFAILATEPGTHITITPSTDALAAGAPPFGAGLPFAVVLDRHGALELDALPAAGSDLSGSTITADRPIVVLTGQAHRLEQLPAAADWGTHFLVPPFARSGGRGRVLAREDDTTIYADHQPVAILARGQTFEVAIPAVRGMELDSSAPVFVARDSRAQLMIVVPPETSFTPEHRFASPMPATVDIVAPSDATFGVLLDTVPVASTWHRVGTSSFSFASVSVAGGTAVHTIRHLRPDVRLSASISGATFAYVGEQALSDPSASHSPPVFTSTAAALAAPGVPWVYRPSFSDPTASYTLTADAPLVVAGSSIVWIPTSSDAGTHVFTISAQDASGNITTQAVTIVVAAGAATTPAVEGIVACRQGAFVIGPKPYLCSTDSVFDLSRLGIDFHLEDFERGTLSTPGVQSVYRTDPIFGLNTVIGDDDPNWGGLVDSVDCDDGLIDGSGSHGHDWYDVTGVTAFTFQPPYPTALGFVWTDGPPSVLEAQALVPGGAGAGTIRVNLSPIATGYSGDTAEDRFIGIVNPAGIARLDIRQLAGGVPIGGIEIDHLQYGACRGAEDLVETAGLTVGQIRYAHSDSVPVGTVMERIPAGLAGLPPGTPVDLIISLGPNSPPIFTSTPPLTARENELYRYAPSAIDPDAHDVVGFVVVDGPTGMAYDELAREVRFLPSTRDIGTYSVRLLAIDTGGLYAEQRFTLTVTGSDNPPVISSLPPTTVRRGERFTYTLESSDPDAGDRLTCVLDIAPEGMQITPDTCTIFWVPSGAQVGGHAVLARVTDRAGAVATQSFLVTVLPVPGAPTIITRPPTAAVQDRLYSYSAAADDPDPGDIETWSLIAAPHGATLTGSRIDWIPNARQVGAQNFVLQVRDATHRTDAQRWTVLVENVNDPPSIVSTPLTHAAAGEAYRYVAAASDDDLHDTKTWSLGQHPAGMTISATGIVTWPSPTETTGVTIRVEDGGGLADAQTFTLVVDPDTRPPRVAVTVDPSTLDPGQPATISISAEDNVAVASRQVSINGAPLALDPSGRATYTPASPGVYIVDALGTDTAGNHGTARTAFGVRDAADTTPPVAILTAPREAAIITAPTQIYGAVADANIVSYDLAIAKGERGAFTVLASISGADAQRTGVLGLVDPTLLENGQYNLRLDATDVNGTMTSTSVGIQIQGGMKIGVFALGFNDLQIPLSGIPITVTRTYDSRVKTKEDFGIGWMLSVAVGRYENNRAPGSAWHFAESRPIAWNPGQIFIPCISVPPMELASHHTEVRLSDREWYTFAVQFANSSRIAHGCLAEAQFVQVDGTLPGATLDILGNNIVWQEFGTDDVRDDDTLEIFNPHQVRLTTYDGRVVDFDREHGVTHLADPSANEIFINRDGITHSSGTSISFTRDAQERITSIIDPLGGMLEYVYDGKGDLERFVDQEGNTTRFTYDARHALIDIFDPLGNRAIRSEYDDDGRLVATTDARGNRTTFTHDLGAQRESMTDRLGYTKFLDYDVRGNVVTETYPGNPTVTVSRAFDSQDNVLGETNELGETTTWTYNAYRRKLSETNPLGETKTWTYDPRGAVLTKTNARGAVTRYVNDFAGRPLSITDAEGFTTTFAYDNLGNLVRECDPRGYCTRRSYDGGGHLVREVDRRGVPVLRAYDASGQVLTETTTRAVSGGIEPLTTAYVRNARGLVIQVRHPDDSVTQKEYDARGLLSRTIDGLGRATIYEYDEEGRRTHTRYADQTTEARVYDAEGHEVARTDRDGRTTTFDYDDRGRLLRKTSDGATLTFGYDAAGRVVSTTDRRGNTSTKILDAAGHVIEFRNPLSQRTFFLHDAAGKVRRVRDAKGRTSTNTYDLRSLLTRVDHPDGTFETMTYDEAGNRVTKTDAEARTTHYAFDGENNLIAVTNPAGEIWNFAYDELSNLAAETDPLGHTTTFQYDEMGRQRRRSLPTSATQARVYDALGNLTRKINYSGTITDYGYDLNNRPASRMSPEGTISMAYSPSGERLSAVDAHGATNYDYDGSGRLASVSDPRGRTLAYAYDAEGDLVEMTAQIGADTWTETYTYDALNRPVNVDAGGDIFSISYDPTGQVASIIYPNGDVTSYDYDALDRVVAIIVRDSQGRVTASWSYARSPAGNITSVLEADGALTEYEYDLADRLTMERVSLGGSVLSVRGFVYDSAGNRVEVDFSAAGGPTHSEMCIFDARDRLFTQGGASFTWDEDGRVLTRAGANGYAASWDSQDRLLRVDYANGISVEHAYDGDGLQVRESVTSTSGASQVTEFLVDPRRALSHVVADVDPVSSSVRARYVRVDDRLLAVYRGGEKRYVHRDQGGSVRALSDPKGALTDRYRYSPFGELLEHEGVDLNRYLFAGERFDARAQLSYNRARWMEPATGRFLSIDPEGELVENWRTLHRYLYASDNPIGFTDPTGRFSLAESMSALGDASIVQAILFAAAAGATLYVASLYADRYGPALSQSVTNAINEHTRRIAEHCAHLLGAVVAGMSPKQTNGPPGDPDKHWFGEIKAFLKNILKHGYSNKQLWARLSREFTREELIEIRDALREIFERFGEDPPDFPPTAYGG